MTIISKLSRLVDGVQRDVELSSNTLKVDTLQTLSKIRFGADGSHTDLIKAQIDTLLMHEHAPGSDNQNVVAGSGLTGGGSDAEVTLSVGAGDGISVAADSVAVDSTVARKAGILMDSDADITLQGGGEILGLPNAPSTESAATSKKYTDDQDALKLNKAGDTMTGTLTMSASIDMQSVQKITNLAAGFNSGDAVNKAQLDDKADVSKVVRKDLSTTMDANVAITMTGGEILGLPSNPTTDGSAASKKYVDDSLVSKANDSVVVKKDGSVAFTANQSLGGNQITNLGAPSFASDAANKNYVDDQDTLKVSKTGDTLSGYLTLHADPTSNMHAATKKYVDDVAQGLDIHQEVVLKMDPNDLPNHAATGMNASKTLTANVNGALGSIQGRTMVVGDSVMLTESPETFNDGIYVVTNLGSASSKWTMVRRDKEDGTPSNEVKPGNFFFVTHGTYAASGWVVTAEGDIDGDGEIDIDMGDKFTVVQFSGAGSYSADGQGIEILGTEISLELDGSTLSKSANGIKVAASGITDTELASSSVMEAKIANSAVTTSKIANSAVESGKIADGAVTSSKIAANAVTETELNASVAGDGLTGGGGSALSIDHAGEGLGFTTGKLDLVIDGTTLIKTTAGIRVQDGGIANIQIRDTAAISLSKLAAGTASDLIIANGSGVPAYVQMSGDATIDSAGVITIGIGAVTSDKLAGNIPDSQLDQIVTADKVAGSAVQLKVGAGLKDDTGLAVAIDDIVGNGIENNGSDKLQIKLATNSGLECTASGLAVVGGSSADFVAGEAFLADMTFVVRFAMSGETVGRVYKTDHDTSTLDKFYAIGLVQPTAGTAAGDIISVKSAGSLVLGSGDTNFSASDIGRPVYVSAAGGFTVTPPTTVGTAVVQLGMVQATNKIWIQPIRISGVN